MKTDKKVIPLSTARPVMVETQTVEISDEILTSTVIASELKFALKHYTFYYNFRNNTETSGVHQIFF